jgi:prepilin-type N-terminal cleavage/methylation domain-containing protein/prepilin-type processing-associated H-X9-DG protein
MAHNAVGGQHELCCDDVVAGKCQQSSKQNVRAHRHLDWGRIMFKPSLRCQGFTLAEILVAIGILSLLLTLLLPAVQAARAATRAAQCRNNLKQIGLALNTFHAAKNAFPPGSDLLSQTEHAWSSYLLPFLEQSTLADQIDYRQPWNVGRNGQVAEQELPVFSCPAALALFPGKQDYGGIMGTSLLPLVIGAGPRDAFGCGVLILTNPAQPRPVRSSTITDGLSTTLAVGEAVDRVDDESARWACGRNCFAQNEPWINADQGDSLHSHHANGAHGLFADGHVKLLTDEIQQRVLGALCSRNAGDEIAEAAN